MKKTHQKLLLATAIIFLFVTGCVASGNRGILRRDRELGQMFMSYQVMPDHNYFTSGGYDNCGSVEPGRPKTYYKDPGHGEETPGLRYPHTLKQRVKLLLLQEVTFEESCSLDHPPEEI